MKFESFAENAELGVTFGASPARAFSNLNLAPPFVSFVVINWNYAAFVADTILSIRQQDYPNFECLVIDNGSTDDSLAVIEASIADDERFRVQAFEENLGQLGAAQWAVENTSGNFISFIDADDILFPNFASTHVQAHLALPSSVSFTSSAIVEIDRDKHVLSTGDLLSFDSTPTMEGLLPAEKAIRISTISDDVFEHMNANAVSLPWNMQGWFWGPGSSNMFRRSILHYFLLPNDGKPILRASDGHFLRLSHALTGSALINIPLSAYRLHGDNYFARRERLQDIFHYDKKDLDGVERGILESAEHLMREADRFSEIVGWRYWSMLDVAANAAQGYMRERFYASPHARRVFMRHARAMRAIDSDERYVSEIFARFNPIDAQIIVGASFSGQIPPELFDPYRPDKKTADDKASAGDETASDPAARSKPASLTSW